MQENWINRNIKNGLKLFSVKAVPLTSITALAAVLFVFLLSEKLDENIIKTIFIGLASLTLPHILLEILDKKIMNEDLDILLCAQEVFVLELTVPLKL